MQSYRRSRFRSAIAAVLTAAFLLCQPAGYAAASYLPSAKPLQADCLSSSKDAGTASLKKLILDKAAGAQAVSIPKKAASRMLQWTSVSKSAASPGYAYVSQRSGYKALSSGLERTLYDFIGQGVYQVANEQFSGYYPVGEITVQGKLSEAQIRTTVVAYTDDNPQIFWLANAFSYNNSGSETNLQLYSYLPADACNSAIDSFSSRVAEVVRSIPSGLSPFDREEYLFHYLVDHCSYNKAAESDTNLWQAFSAYGALTDGNVVCEGYSRAMQLLCSYAGLQCVLIRGTSGGTGHMWNGVNIDGNWYHLDITWCDNTVPVYNYFNVTDSVIKQSRSIAPALSSMTEKQICASDTQCNLFLPVCASAKANYYAVRGVKIKDLSSSSENVIIKTLTSDLTNGKTSIPFYIDAKSDYSSIVNNLVVQSPYKMKAYLQKAAQASGKSYEQVSYVLDKANRGLSLYVTYP